VDTNTHSVSTFPHTLIITLKQPILRRQYSKVSDLHSRMNVETHVMLT